MTSTSNVQSYWYANPFLSLMITIALAPSITYIFLCQSQCIMRACHCICLYWLWCGIIVKAVNFYSMDRQDTQTNKLTDATECFIHATVTSSMGYKTLSGQFSTTVNTKLLQLNQRHQIKRSVTIRKSIWINLHHVNKWLTFDSAQNTYQLPVNTRT